MKRKMAFDASHLIHHWRRRRKNRDIDQISRRVIEGWATELVALHLTDLICTPVRVEFLCNTGGAGELERVRRFLAKFRTIDGGETTRDDWFLAERFAPKRKGDVKAVRQLGDCIIAAIFRRFGCSLVPTSNLDLDLFRRVSSPDRK